MTSYRSPCLAGIALAAILCAGPAVAQSNEQTVRLDSSEEQATPRQSGNGGILRSTPAQTPRTVHDHAVALNSPGDRNPQTAAYAEAACDATDWTPAFLDSPSDRETSALIAAVRARPGSTPC